MAGSQYRQQSTSTVTIPADLATRVEARLPHSQFGTVDEYVTYVIEDVVSRVEDADDETFEAVSQAEVEARLKSLGYLD